MQLRIHIIYTAIALLTINSDMIGQNKLQKRIRPTDVECVLDATFFDSPKFEVHQIGYQIIEEVEKSLSELVEQQNYPKSKSTFKTDHKTDYVLSFKVTEFKKGYIKGTKTFLPFRGDRYLCAGEISLCSQFGTVIASSPVTTYFDFYHPFLHPEINILVNHEMHSRNLAGSYNPPEPIPSRYQYELTFSFFLENPKFKEFLSNDQLADSMMTFQKLERIPNQKVIQKNNLASCKESTVQISTKSGFGSGCIIREDGIIITNYHVIANEDTIHVKTQSNGNHQAKLIAQDPGYDLAILKIENPTTPFSFQFKYDWAEPIKVIGSPADTLNFNSISAGIISGDVTFPEKTMILTNAGINGGNSGGALINKNFELIGIVTSKLKGYGSEGIGMAVPIQYAIELLEKASRD